jgi:hypothetical protein
MPILTLTELKVLMQIPATDATLDPLLETLLPSAQERVVRYCNSAFLASGVQVYGVGISFTAPTTGPAGPGTIVDSGGRFLEAGFSDGCDVKVRGSALNDGIYTVKTAAAGTLTLELAARTEAEAAGKFVVLSRLRWPKGLGIPFSVLLRYLVEKSGKLVSQETLPGGYAVIYKSEAEVMKLFNEYRRPL